MLANNNIGNDGAEALIDSLSENTSIEDLPLIDCNNYDLEKADKLSTICSRNLLFPAYCLQQMDLLIKQLPILLFATKNSEIWCNLPIEIFFQIIPFPEEIPEKMRAQDFFPFIKQELLPLAEENPLPSDDVHTQELKSLLGRWLQTTCARRHDEYLEKKACTDKESSMAM